MVTKSEIDKKVKDVLKYANTLNGIKYIWWEGNEKDRDDLFYYDDPKTLSFIKKNGVNCAGFVNLLMHNAGVKLPPSKNKYRGGTGFWYNYFKKNNKLKPFDYTKDYDIGTLVLRKYRNVKDQGHFVVFHSKYKKNPKMILYGNIIHSYWDDDEDKGLVGITNFGKSHFWGSDDDVGYYEYIIEPKDWLF